MVTSNRRGRWTKHRWDTRIGDGNGIGTDCTGGPPSGQRIWDAEAFARFLTHDDEVLVMLDADGTYAPKDMLRLIQHLERGEYDVVIGSRLRGKIQPGAMSRMNWIGSHFDLVCGCLYRVFISDVCTGYWAFKRNAIQKMSLNSTAFEIEAEMFSFLCK